MKRTLALFAVVVLASASLAEAAPTPMCPLAWDQQTACLLNPAYFRFAVYSDLCVRTAPALGLDAPYRFLLMPMCCESESRLHSYLQVVIVKNSTTSDTHDSVVTADDRPLSRQEWLEAYNMGFRHARHRFIDGIGLYLVSAGVVVMIAFGSRHLRRRRT